MKSYFFYMSHSFFLFRLANKLQPGAVKMNDTKKVTNAAMRTNKEVRNSFVANNQPYNAPREVHRLVLKKTSKVKKSRNKNRDQSELEAIFSCRF